MDSNKNVISLCSFEFPQSHDASGYHVGLNSTRNSPLWKNKRAKSDKPWRNSLGIQFLNEWAHRCSFKVIQASTAPYQSTFPVIQIIYSSDTIFPSLLFKRKGQGCKMKVLNSHRRILLCSVYSWGRTNLLNATRATQWTAGNTKARTRAEMSRGEQVILHAKLWRHACNKDRQTQGLANYTA